MISIYRAALATPATMPPGAYRELCWGAGLDHTATGYGLLLGADTADGALLTAVIEDIDYVRLLIQAGGAEVPEDKVSCYLDGWPDLSTEAPTVWP
ncbi:hypothetical protein ACFU99_28805 [Streptomyces sp. NPDC057654]|uniref:hypothetical protein n=1 Tax=Streptomyces sp. NPDC057654 TaxID=3346196 RepID=UPI0036C3F75D